MANRRASPDCLLPLHRGPNSSALFNHPSTFVGMLVFRSFGDDCRSGGPGSGLGESTPGTTDDGLLRRIAKRWDPKRCNSDHKVVGAYSRRSIAGRLVAGIGLYMVPTILDKALGAGSNRLARVGVGLNWGGRISFAIQFVVSRSDK